MATVAASTGLSSATITAATISGTKTQRRTPKIMNIGGLNNYGGLRAQNKVTGLGLPLCTEQYFAKFVSSVRSTSISNKRGGGGALSSTCNAAGEIFAIASIMNGLVLVGVAVGFVLLRIEAAVEEAE